MHYECLDFLTGLSLSRWPEMWPDDDQEAKALAAHRPQFIVDLVHGCKLSPSVFFDHASGGSLSSRKPTNFECRR